MQTPFSYNYNYSSLNTLAFNFHFSNFKEAKNVAGSFLYFLIFLCISSALKIQSKRSFWSLGINFTFSFTNVAMKDAVIIVISPASHSPERFPRSLKYSKEPNIKYVPLFQLRISNTEEGHAQVKQV